MNQEEENWSMDRAWSLLARAVVPRRVDRSGTTSVYGRNYDGGKAHVDQDVFVRYDPPQQLWLVQDSQGHQLNRHPATVINQANIRELLVPERRERAKKGKLPVGISVG